MSHDHSMMNHSAHQHMAEPPGHAQMGHDMSGHDRMADTTGPCANMHGAHGMMSMTFHGGYCETILFSGWKIEGVGGLIGSMIAIFVVAALYETLKYYRENLFWKTHNSLQYRAVTVPDKNIPGRNSQEDNRVVHMVGEVVHKQPQSMMSWMNALQTVLHAVQVTVSFLLMLIFMTYNYWLCFAVVLGASTGYFLFGWKKSVIVDVTEHCH